MRRYLAFSCLLMMLFASCATTRNTPPRLIRNSLIILYPPEARIKRLEGAVKLLVLVDEMGNVRDAKVSVSSGYPLLDRTAVEIARDAKFKPALSNGKRRAVWVTWPLVFKFESVKFLPDKWAEKVWELHWETDRAKGKSKRKSFRRFSIITKILLIT